MWEDPIVEEVHQTRKQLAAQFGFDVQAVFADMRKRQSALGARLVTSRKSNEPTDAADRGARSMSNADKGLAGAAPGD
jgi:hypothetical protein